MELRRLSKLGNEGRAYFEFLRTGHFSAGVYRLPVNAIDNQRPHAQDEIYYVVSGAASFRSGESDITVAPGDILFVPANEPHRFYDIRRDLEVLVVFAPPESHDV
jgi:mannose-6-phosphate isomerase-like protein (cupin superfamily)